MCLQVKLTVNNYDVNKSWRPQIREICFRPCTPMKHWMTCEVDVKQPISSVHLKHSLLFLFLKVYCGIAVSSLIKTYHSHSFMGQSFVQTIHALCAKTSIVAHTQESVLLSGLLECDTDSHVINKNTKRTYWFLSANQHWALDSGSFPKVLFLSSFPVMFSRLV